MNKLILIRHGETPKNVVGLMHKASDLAQLTENGREQMVKTAKALKEYYPFVIYSSKEIRAIESAQIIAQEYGLSAVTINGLEERNWGDFSSKNWLEIKDILDKMTLEERFKFIPPNGESWENLESRLTKVVNDVFIHCQNKSAVIVTHGGAIRALIPRLLKVPKDESFKYSPDNASLSVFDKISEDTFSETFINSTAHLM